MSLVDFRDRPLDLIEPALGGALILRRAFPGVVFTSGRRSIRDQANAMAENVALSMKRNGHPAGETWLIRTYKATPVRDALVRWLRGHPSAFNSPGIAAGFMSVFRSMPEDEVARVSKHLVGLAFDVRPVHGMQEGPVLQCLRTLPHLDKFLDREGGLIRWHAQFNRLPATEAAA